jgi:hypothetical protein
MGILVDRSTFTDDEYVHAGVRLRENLKALGMLLKRPEFGLGPTTLGAEVELSIIDAEAEALPLNRQLLAESLDPHLQLELDRFNLEYNLTPVPAAGAPFAAMQSELEIALHGLADVAAGHGGRIVPIGILPTLKKEQLQPRRFPYPDRRCRTARRVVQQRLDGRREYVIPAAHARESRGLCALLQCRPTRNATRSRDRR